MPKSAQKSAKQKKMSTSPAVAAPTQENDFIAPEDLIGSELAAQLQGVLDEARLQLDDDATYAASDTNSPGDPTVDQVDDSEHDSGHDAAQTRHPADGVTDSDDATFESPDEVLRTAADMGEPDSGVIAEALAVPADEAAAPEPDNVETFEAQLKQLLAMGTPDGADATSSDNAPFNEADDAMSLDADTVSAQAQEMGHELDEMASLIDEAVAAPQGSPIEEPQVAATSGSTMKQLDEFLAGHADHAVSDEFETVQDAMGGVTAAQSPASVPTAVRDDMQSRAAEDDDEFASLEELLNPGAALLAPAASHSALVAGLSPVMPASDAQSPAPTFAAPASEAAPGVQEAGASDAKSSRLQRSGQMLKRIIVIASQQSYQVCRLLNRPLQNASSSTRRTIGMIGLITLANASLLIVGKWLNLWG